MAISLEQIPSSRPESRSFPTFCSSQQRGTRTQKNGMEIAPLRFSRAFRRGCRDRFSVQYEGALSGRLCAPVYRGASIRRVGGQSAADAVNNPCTLRARRPAPSRADLPPDGTRVVRGPFTFGLGFLPRMPLQPPSGNGLRHPTVLLFTESMLRAMSRMPRHIPSRQGLGKIRKMVLVYWGDRTSVME